MNPVNKQQARRKGAKRQAWHLGAGVALGIAAVGVGQPALAAVITTIDDFSDPQPILVADDAGCWVVLGSCTPKKQLLAERRSM